MKKIKMNIANNRTTKEMVGYYVSAKLSIVVVAYDAETLQKKFDKALNDKLNTTTIVRDNRPNPCKHPPKYIQQDVSCGKEITVCTKCGDVF